MSFERDADTDSDPGNCADVLSAELAIWVGSARRLPDRLTLEPNLREVPGGLWAAGIYRNLGFAFNSSPGYALGA